MKIREYLSLLLLAFFAVLAFYGSNVDACMCQPSHPQTHYCNADYVVQLRVLRKSRNLLPNQVVYKVQIKKSYKLNEVGHRVLKHSRLTTPDISSACGVELTVGKVYVVAGRGSNLNLCSYVKEYVNMSVIERRGFLSAYRKGCKCEIEPCFGNRCLEQRETVNGCRWSPFAKCETDYSFCIPSTYRTPEGNIARCHWRHTMPYKKCMHDP